MASEKNVDLLITGGTVLCMDADLRTLENHSVAVDKGRILDIFPDGSAVYQARETLNAADCIVMPGLINAHTHLPMTYFRGLADDLPLQAWLNDYIWPLEAKLLDRDFIRASALHGAAEMIKNGITQIHDMYFDMPSIADACSQAGLRAIIGEAVIEARLSDPASRKALGTKVLEMRRRYWDDPLVDFDLAPHSLYACSQATLEQCAQVASEHGILIHTHLSETKNEVEKCLAEHDKKPVFYLRDLGLLALRAVYAHAIWVDGDEIALLAENPASIAVCTECNLKLASGILPLSSYLKHGVNVCFATDGVASNNNLDLLAELDVTAKLHKAINEDPAFLPAQQALGMATRNAAKALGISDKRGSLEVGKDADITVLDACCLNGQPLYNPYSHLVYALGARSVRDVVINGEVVLRQGNLTKVDEAEIIASAKQYQTKIKAALH